MVRIACPRCHQVIDAEPSGEPTCPNCGFTGAVGETPPPSGFRIGEHRGAPAAKPSEPWAPAPGHGPAPRHAATSYPAHPPPGTADAPSSAYPGSPVQPYGGFWIRVVAYILDALVVGIPLAILASIVAVGIDPRLLEEGSPVFDGVVQGVSLLAGWLYMATMQSSRHQASLGKMAVGLKVTDLRGRRISFGRATGRHFAQILSALILLIGYFMIGWTAKKQGLHDMIAGTLVYKKDFVPSEPPAPLGAWG